MGLLITTYANLVNVWKTSGKAGKQRVNTVIAFNVGRMLPNTDLSRAFMGLVMGQWILESPADIFAGADDITKEREPGIEIIEHTP